MTSGIGCFGLMKPALGSFHGLPTYRELQWSLESNSGYLLTAERPPRLWRIPAGLEVMRKTHVRAEQAWSCSFTADNVLLGRKEWILVRYDLSNPSDIRELPWASNPDYAFGASHPPSGTFLLAQRTGAPPFDCKFYSSPGNEPVERWSTKLGDAPTQVEFDQAGERLLVVYVRAPAVEVLSARSGESLLKIPHKMQNAVFAGKADNIIGLIASKRSATGAADELWQLDGRTGKLLRTNAFNFRGNCLVVSPDHSLIALGGADRMIHISEAETLKVKMSIRVHDDEVTALAFHPSRPVIATASMDGSVKLWDYTTKKMVNYFIGLEGTPVCLSFSPNGKLLAVDGQEFTSRVFDVSKDMPGARAK